MICKLGDVEAIRYYLSENTCRRELSDSTRNETLSLLKNIRDGIDVLEAESGGEKDAGKEEGELWTPTCRGVEPPFQRGRPRLADRWNIDRQVEEAAAVATILDLLERTERFLENVRVTKKIEIRLAREIVDGLLGLPDSFSPLMPSQVYGERMDNWLARHCLLSRARDRPGSCAPSAPMRRASPSATGWSECASPAAVTPS